MADGTTYRVKTTVNIHNELQTLLNKYYPDTKPEVSVDNEQDAKNIVYYFDTRWSHDQELEESIVSLFNGEQGFIWIDEERSDFIEINLYNDGILRNNQSIDKEFLF